MLKLRPENELNEIYHLGKIDQPVGATIVFGGQAGSEGKGAIAGYLARRYQWGAAISTFMPNAGHTWLEKDGADPVVVTQLPISLVSDTVARLYLGASSVIKLSKLEEEIAQFDKRGFDVSSRLRIHPRAQIMHPEYEAWEAENLKYIASTGKGCGAAIAAKARREIGVALAKDSVPWLRAFVSHNMDVMLNDMVNRGLGILVEQAQGFDLDINHGVEYPYCTSRQCTPTQIMADIGLSERLVTNSIAVVRTHPIKVGNAEGHSGQYVSPEIDWKTVSSRAGRNVEERTTVTNRVRRVFEFDFDRIGEMSEICRPTMIALTFSDYIDPQMYGKTQGDFRLNDSSLMKMSPKVSSFIYRAEYALRRSTFNPKIKLIKTGPADDHTLDLGISI